VASVFNLAGAGIALFMPADLSLAISRITDTHFALVVQLSFRSVRIRRDVREAKVTAISAKS
jgi:hypothetical protein